MVGRLLGACALVALGCSPPPTLTPEPDAGGPELGAVAPPSPPLSPSPVKLTPCPPGWQELPAAGAPSICEPWPAADAGTCAVDQARFPGDPGCRLVGTACTTDEWASGLPGGVPTLFVRAGAPSGGNGSRSAPYGTISAAMAVAAPGSVVALSKGTFDGAVSLRTGVTLWGACVAQTFVTAPAAGGVAAVVQAAGLGGVVRNLRLGGPRIGVLANPSGNSLSLEDLVIDRAEGMGILAGNAASVSGHDVVVRDTQMRSGSGGRAIGAEYGGQVSLSRVVLENNRQSGVSASEPGSRIRLTDAAIRGTSSRGDGAMGYGASVLRQAELALTRAVLEQNQSAGILGGAGAKIELTDVVVRDTRSSANLDDSGHGLVIEEDASATLARCTFLRNRSAGVTARTRAKLKATHLMVLGTLPTPATGADGAGVSLEGGAEGVLDHAFLENNHSAGVSVDASRATLLDVEIRGTAASHPAAGEYGSGLQAINGAAVGLERVRIVGSELVGALLDGAGTVANGSDLQVLDSRCSSSDGTGGSGVAVQAGATLTLVRLALERNRSVALQVSDPGTQVTLEDAVLRDTASDAAGGRWGRGVHAQSGARLSVKRALLERNRDVGVFVAGATAALEDVRIVDTGKRACVAASTCENRGGSAAVVLGQAASLTMLRFVLARSAQCGLQLAEGGVADLVDGEVAENLIGASVMTEGFDLARISGQVVYRDNARKLDSASMPLPEANLPKPGR
ncbi:MAG: right-handed parallel beta-helix repeat-containing protein [Myxococcaceae bacterium]